MTYERPLALPASRAEIDALQRKRKKLAVEKARRSLFWRDKLEGIDTDKLDDPAEWAKIPILHKETLRALSNEAFYSEFCHAPRSETAEFWRSGGSTGKPLFYPRTHEDMPYTMLSFERTFHCMGVQAGKTAHLSFPLGIHPAGQMWARAGEAAGIGIAWAGAGAAAPSHLQLQLIEMLKPDIWMGMSSYGLHLANLAEAQGIDLSQSSIEEILCTAEPLSMAKRAKLERMWGATVFDAFGMTEITMMGAEAGIPGELHIWTDLSYLEVLDPETNEPVAPGERGALVVTALFTNHCTPFLRWSSGDIVIYQDEGTSDTPYAVFPVLRHTHRTAGFFKVRGININHSELEDLMFAERAINDFKAEALETGGLDALRLSLEIARGAEADQVAAAVAVMIKRTFEITPEIRILETGTLAGEFESAVKAPRFADLRQT